MSEILGEPDDGVIKLNKRPSTGGRRRKASGESDGKANGEPKAQNGGTRALVRAHIVHDGEAVEQDVLKAAIYDRAMGYYVRGASTPDMLYRVMGGEFPMVTMEQIKGIIKNILHSLKTGFTEDERRAEARLAIIRCEEVMVSAWSTYDKADEGEQADRRTQLAALELVLKAQLQRDRYTGIADGASNIDAHYRFIQQFMGDLFKLINERVTDSSLLYEFEELFKRYGRLANVENTADGG